MKEPTIKEQLEREVKAFGLDQPRTGSDPVVVRRFVRKAKTPKKGATDGEGDGGDG